MPKTVDPHYLRWQAKTIPANSDFRWVFLLGLLAAWFFFLWQVLALPPFATLITGASPLLRSVVDKGQFMPDFGVIIAAFLAFQFRREFQQAFDRKVAIRIILLVVLSLLVPLLVGFALETVVHVAAGQALVPPWRDALMATQFRVVVIVSVVALLLPRVVFLMWTATPDIGWACVALTAVFYGITFHLHGYRAEWMWAPRILFDALMGVSLCASLYRGAEYLTAVRGPFIIFGIVGLAGGSILANPGVFFMGFLMAVSGCALDERTSCLPGETALLGWSRTAYAIILVQPAVLAAWLAWGGGFVASRWALLGVLAVATQVLAVLLRGLVERPITSLSRRLIPAPIK